MEPWVKGRTKGREDRIHQPAMIARDWTPLMVADAADPEGNSGRGITGSQVSRIHNSGFANAEESGGFDLGLLSGG